MADGGYSSTSRNSEQPSSINEPLETPLPQCRVMSHVSPLTGAHQRRDASHRQNPRPVQRWLGGSMPSQNNQPLLHRRRRSCWIPCLQHTPLPRTTERCRDLKTGPTARLRVRARSTARAAGDGLVGGKSPRKKGRQQRCVSKSLRECRKALSPESTLPGKGRAAEAAATAETSTSLARQ